MAHGHSELARQIYCERFPQRLLPNVRIFVNVVQHLREFGHSEINKRDLGRQREDRILVAEEDILHEIENQPRTSTRRLANHQGVSQFVLCSLVRVQNAAQEVRQNRGIQRLSSLMFRFMLLLTMTVFLLCCLSLCCFLNKMQATILAPLYKFHQRFMMIKLIKI
jgi:hypothetical protein